MNRFLFWLLGVRILRLRPDDILVYHTDSWLSSEARDRVRDDLRGLVDRAGTHTPIAILEGGATLSVIRPDVFA